MRVNQLEASWSEQERVLASMFQEICKHLDVKELELEAIHQDSVEALGKAEGACLFQCPGGSAEKAAGWRHQNYGRLLFHIGLSDKFTIGLPSSEPWRTALGALSQMQQGRDRGHMSAGLLTPPCHQGLLTLKFQRLPVQRRWLLWAGSLTVTSTGMKLLPSWGSLKQLQSCNLLAPKPNGGDRWAKIQVECTSSPQL